MDITREQVETRLELLKRRQESTLADLNALGGAIQDCEFWIARLDQKDDPPKSEENPPESTEEKPNVDSE
jgi:hypothetical protein